MNIRSFLIIFAMSSLLHSEESFGIVVHGGAGVMSGLSEERQQEIHKKIQETVSEAYYILEKGGSSLDAVELAVSMLEDSPLFNAGKGAVLNALGNIELDASFMNGNSLDAGAVSGVKTVKHPISAAIKVMEASQHVMLSGSGADTFAKEQGLEIVDPEYFYTERRINDLKRVKQKTALKESFLSSDEKKYFQNQRYGTVGCVALDINGNLSAGTSTGGMTNKKWNRIGDAPIIGAGTYANNLTCAISATGWGEFFIRSVVAHDISALMEYKNMSIQEAAYEVIHNKVARLGGNGGVIGIDRFGNPMMEMNTPGMYRAHMDADGNLKIKIYKDE